MLQDPPTDTGVFLGQTAAQEVAQIPQRVGRAREGMAVHEPEGAVCAFGGQLVSFRRRRQFGVLLPILLPQGPRPHDVLHALSAVLRDGFNLAAAEEALDEEDDVPVVCEPLGPIRVGGLFRALLRRMECEIRL